MSVDLSGFDPLVTIPAPCFCKSSTSKAKARAREWRRLLRECLLMALFGHPTRTEECPLLGVKADMTRTGADVAE